MDSSELVWPVILAGCLFFFKKFESPPPPPPPFSEIYNEERDVLRGGHEQIRRMRHGGVWDTRE